MPELIPVLDRDAITQIVVDLGSRISSDYNNRELVIVGVLKGALVFMADLIREISGVDVSIDFIRASSYGGQCETSGCVRLLKDIETDIHGKDVLIVEDILDSGLTAAFLVNHLQRSKPKSVKLCAFLEKTHRRRVDLQADYVGFTVEKGFLVGYGLDYAEKYRNCPEVFEMITK